MCDGLGAYCFTTELENDHEGICTNQCDYDCNATVYSYSLMVKPLDGKKFCSGQSSWLERLLVPMNLGSELRYFYNNWKVLYEKYKGIDIDPFYTKQAFACGEKNETSGVSCACSERIESDMALVHVYLGNPTVVRTKQDVKVLLQDKLSMLGSISFTITRTFEFL